MKDLSKNIARSTALGTLLLIGLPLWAHETRSLPGGKTMSLLRLAEAPLGGSDAPAAPGGGAAAPGSKPDDAARQTLVIDDFENGIGGWTLNDPDKVGGAANALLVGMVITRADNPFLAASKGAGLFTFKAGQHAWASASRRVEGAKWVQAGAQRLTFYLAADGDVRPNMQRGVDLVLRAHVTNGADEVFRLPLDPQTKKPIMVRLDRSRAWRQVAIPLNDFSSAGGPLTTEALKRVYLLQFVQTGTWDSRFFSLDQLQVDDQGASTQTTPTPQPAKPSPPARPTPDPDAVTVSVDFKRVEGRIAASANMSLGTTSDASGSPDRVPLEDADFRNAVIALKARFVRLDAGELCEMTDSSTPAFDYTQLKSAASRVRAIGALPLIALTSPPEWALDAHGYAVFARDAALALNGKGATPGARYWELSSDSVTFYNGARAALRGVNPDFRIGGNGSDTREDEGWRVLLGGASGLDFLSVSDYGSVSDSEDPFTAARTAARLRAVAGVLRASKFRDAALYVTQANMRAVDNDTGVNLTGMSAAAWWAAYMGSASRVANQVFQEDAANPDAGLLTSSSSAYPTYYAMYLWNTYFPGGSARVQTTSSGASIVAVAVNTPTAHNLLVVNTSNKAQSVQIGIRGFPILHAARMHLLENRASSVRNTELAKSPFQNLTLKPYAVAVLQFVEGTRKR